MLLLIWSGRGWLIWVTSAVVGFILNSLADRLHGPDAWGTYLAYPGLWCLLMAVVCWWLSSHWLREESAELMMLRNAGPTVVATRTRHRFLFMPARVWMALYGLAGAVLFLVGLVAKGL